MAAEMWGNTNHQIRFLLPKTMVFLIFLCSFEKQNKLVHPGSSWIILDHHPACVVCLAWWNGASIAIPPTWTVPGNCQAARKLQTHYIYIYIYNHSYYWNEYIMNIYYPRHVRCILALFAPCGTEARRWRCGCRRTGPSMLLGASQRRVSPKDSRRHGIYHWYMIYRSQDCYIPIFHWFKIVTSPSFIDLPTKMS